MRRITEDLTQQALEEGRLQGRYCRRRRLRWRNLKEARLNHFVRGDDDTILSKIAKIDGGLTVLRNEIIEVASLTL